MRETGGIKVESDTIRLCPGNPIFEMLEGDFVAIDFLSAELAVEGVKVQAMFAGNQRKRLVQIGAEFIRCARFAGMVAGGDESAAEGGVRVFKTADIVALPAV